MKRRLLLATLFALALMTVSAQSSERPQFGERPKLVVGIVVDQMRWDYLSRYYDKFVQDGSRRLIDKGYSFDNCLINYLPTITAIGHTSAYTGTTPAFHGICGNSFIIDGRKTYCCDDKSVKPVGSDNEKSGSKSPILLLSTTIGDQLRMHTDFRSKVIGVSYKDRASILPAGRSGNAAYWLDTKNRQFITSTYYMTELPQWAKDYNKQLAKDEEFKKVGKDVGLYPLTGHITTDMAIAALKGEQLGKGEETDMLCVSYSQTDVIGHKWSPRSKQIDEAYMVLDKDLERLLKALDEQVGQGNYLVFLTADHGGAQNFQWMRDHGLSGGKWSSDDVKRELETYFINHLHNKMPLVSGVYDYRFYLNHETIANEGLELKRVKEVAMEFLRQSPNIHFVVDFEQAAIASVPDFLRERILRGYNMHRSGDIIVIPEPGYYEFGRWSSPDGTTHGEWNPYDAHIPLLFYGWKVPHGASPAEVHITDIAPTVCSLLHIQQPNACIGDILHFNTK